MVNTVPSEVRLQQRRSYFLLNKLINKVPDDLEESYLGVTTSVAIESEEKSKELRKQKRVEESDRRVYIVHSYDPKRGFYIPSEVYKNETSGHEIDENSNIINNSNNNNEYIRTQNNDNNNSNNTLAGNNNDFNEINDQRTNSQINRQTNVESIYNSEKHTGTDSNYGIESEFGNSSRGDLIEYSDDGLSLKYSDTNPIFQGFQSKDGDDDNNNNSNNNSINNEENKI